MPHPGRADPGLIAQALDLPEAAIGFGAHRSGIWQAGPAFLFVPVAGLDDLARSRPIEPYWTQLMQAAAVDSAYLYTPGAGCDFQARMYSPTAGIPEDPATGSASAILAAQLLAAGALTSPATGFRLKQGVEMGRPSEIGLHVDCRDGVISAIRVSGKAVHIASGRIHAPSV